jgi:hypothetical protein
MNNFTFFTNYSEVINSLPEEFRAEMCLAICQYGSQGIEPEFSNPILSSVFISLKFNLDKSISRANAPKEGREINEKQSENKPKTKPKQKKAKNNLFSNTDKTNEKQTSSNSISSSISFSEKGCGGKPKKEKREIKFPTLESLKGLTEQSPEVVGLTEDFDVPVAFVWSKRDDLESYCKASGRRYKDYLAALRTFVKRDALKIKSDQQKGASDKSKIAFIDPLAETSSES